jgi:ribosomal protein S12 methylthiotransferase
VGFVSLGCAKNLVDSQVMAGELLADDLRLAPSPERADVLVVNTCAFIEPARREAAEAIGRACAHKAAGGCRAVIVTGCLPQRDRRGVRRDFPGVDAVLGVDELDRLPAVVRQLARGRRGPDGPAPTAPSRLFRPRLPALRFTGGPFAYLKIAEGCDHACAFCAIPAIRGRFRSRPLGELVGEARALLDSGVRELNLIAQDTTSYGRDRRGGPDLADLVDAFDGLGGTFWIRLLYGYPSRVSDRLLAALARSRHALPYFDLPIQHSHPDILRAMRRADTIAVLPGLAGRLRRAWPGAVLRTTCLVGFPGETEAHVDHLLTFLTVSRFDHVGVFVYSREAGTAAGRRQAPAAAVAEARRERVLTLQSALVRERSYDLAGREETALLLAPPRRGARWTARLVRQAPEVDGLTRVAGVPAAARAGDFARVRLLGCRGIDNDAVAV